jgi:hypothetical protein
MKKILGLLSIMALTVFVTMPMYAQTPGAVPEKIVVNKSDLTTSQLLKIESDARIAELEKKLQTYGNWVGVGGEIGTAIKEGLTAVVDVADKFGGTNVGKFTMVMVAWKVIGKDLTRIGLGLIFIFFSCSFIIYVYRKNYVTRKIMTKGNRLLFWQPREYKVIEPSTYEGFEFVRWLYVAMFLGTFGFGYLIMFV